MGVAMAAVSMGATILGGVFKAFGAMQEAQAQSRMLQYQAGIAKINAQLMEQNRVHAIQAGETQAWEAGLRGGQVMGRIKAAQGASGIDIAGPSSQAVQEGQAFANRTTQDIIRENAAHLAYNYGAQETAYKAASSMYSAGSSNIMRAMPFAVASSLLGTAGSVADKWMQASQAGVFGGMGS